MRTFVLLLHACERCPGKCTIQPAMEQKAWILRNFLERQKTMDEDAANTISTEFLRLKNQSTKYRSDKTFPVKTAESPENVKKNRYKDIVPFDHSRVKLTLKTSAKDTDYINASFIQGVTGSRAYIATQGPLPQTLLDYLRMLWEYNVQVIVMACREIEMGKRKCERYWPQNEEELFVCEPFTVYCDSEEDKGPYLTRTLRLTYLNQSRTLKQLHYVNWPDHGVPDSIPTILSMVHEMRSYQSHDDIPICIHCSAGCGRTGALCVIDYTWNLLKKHMITPEFNIYDLVHTMRTQRPSVVQTKEQYELVCRAVKLLFERYLQAFDTQEETPDAESKDLDVGSQLQHLCDEERDIIKHFQQTLPSAPNNAIACDEQRDHRQHLLQIAPGALATSQELPEGHSQRATATVGRTEDDIPPLNPPPSLAVAPGLCITVEDPYFDTLAGRLSLEEVLTDSSETTRQPQQILHVPTSSVNDQTLEFESTAGSVEAHIDEDVPPPLPERTPESYVLCVNEDNSVPCKRLTVIIQPNAAAAAVWTSGGGPPSPVPPLPERTPESFQLAVDRAPVKLEITPAVNLSRLGISSEWSGNSKSTTSQSEMRPWVRSKSLKLLQPQKLTPPAPSSNPTSDLHVYCPPLTPPLHQCAAESLTPPLPDRTPQSFVFTTDKHECCTAPLNAVRHPAPAPVVVAEGGSAHMGQRDVRPPLNTQMSGLRLDKNYEKGFLRTRSLKFFRPKKSNSPSPAQPGAPPSSNRASFLGFQLSFGNRFGKPKGPRNYPENWF